MTGTCCIPSESDKPYPSFPNDVPIAQALKTYPQYAGINDVYPNFGSSNYLGAGELAEEANSRVDIHCLLHVLEDLDQFRIGPHLSQVRLTLFGLLQHHPVARKPAPRKVSGRFRHTPCVEADLGI